jgi:hypothetical protein
MKSKSRLLQQCSMLIALLLSTTLFAQENQETTSAPPAKEYVRATFENGVVINNQTVENSGNKSLDFIIQHRFGLIKDSKDLFGLYAPSNIRLGLNYGITDRLGLGVGATKNKYLFDFQEKYVLLKQTKEKGTPVSVTYFFDVA